MSTVIDSFEWRSVFDAIASGTCELIISVAVRDSGDVRGGAELVEVVEDGCRS